MQDMLKAEHAPHLDIYISLFYGFAAYGQIGKQGGSAGSLFPEITTIPLGRTKSLRKTKEPSRGPSKALAFTDIWAMGAQAPSRARSTPFEELDASLKSEGTAFKDEWTYDLLVHLFKSFIALKTGVRGLPHSRNPPSPDDAWTILLAFSRASGGDDEIVRKAWEDMDGKFGGGSGEKWAGWKLNSRLVRVVDGLERRARGA